MLERLWLEVSFSLSNLSFVRVTCLKVAAGADLEDAGTLEKYFKKSTG